MNQSEPDVNVWWRARYIHIAGIRGIFADSPITWWVLNADGSPWKKDITDYVCVAAVYLHAAYVWPAVHYPCLHRKKWWPASCSRLHRLHERIFENLIAKDKRIVQFRIKCNIIIPDVILQMAGGYKFWSGRFLKFASKPTKAESLLIVSLYIHGISVQFGVAVLAFCKKGFLNFAEFWNSLPNPHGAS